jgi:glycosyltransferase involved in cell wall biosynthesis
MGKPFYSVIIPTLNEEKWVGGLLSDLSGQVFRDFEVIVIDAKSDDGTKLVVKKYKSKLPHFEFKESFKRNVSYQRNIGASMAKGLYILFIDADSRISANFLKEERKLLVEQKPDLFSNWFLSTKDTLIYRFYGLIGSVSYWLLARVGFPAAPGTLLGVRRSVFLKLVGFSETIPFAEDRELVRRAGAMGFSFKFFDKPKYFMSLRRIEKKGIVRFVFTIILVNIKRQLGISLNRKKEYPMGGDYD